MNLFTDISNRSNYSTLYISSVLVAVAIFVSACDPKIDGTGNGGALGTLVPTDSTPYYVAIGSTHTAGFHNQALYVGAQNFSYPKLIAHQLKLADFQQPDMDDAVGMTQGFEKRIQFVGIDFNTGKPNLLENPQLKPTITPVNRDVVRRGYNNLGIPFASIQRFPQVLEWSSNQNLFFGRILREIDYGRTVIEQAVKQKPNIVTLMIGFEDVFLNALNGGDVANLGSPIITDSTVFYIAARSVFDSLKYGLPKAAMLISNIPDLESFPVFTSIKFNGMTLTAEQAVEYNQHRQLLPDRLKGELANEGSGNAFMLVDATSPTGMRPARSSDMILLKSSTFTTDKGFGISKGLPASVVLDSIEQSKIRAAIRSYNNKINDLPDFYNNVYIVDIAGLLRRVRTEGYVIPGDQRITADHVLGGMYSLDGYTFSYRGNAIIANEFIKAMNSRWDASIPLLNPLLVPGIEL